MAADPLNPAALSGRTAASDWREPVYSRRDQLQYLALTTLASAVLFTARLLQPSPRGVGTHEQLGLPPCFFLKLTGWPCPSCGLTTSFAYAAKLRFFEALVTQPFGLLAFWLTVFSLPLACYCILGRVPLRRLLFARATWPAVYLLVALYLAGWAYKLAVMRPW